MGRACSTDEEEEKKKKKKNAYRIFVGKPEGKRPLGKPRYRWVVNIATISIGMTINGVWVGEWVY
jgi:hypothetical protein